MEGKWYDTLDHEYLNETKRDDIFIGKFIEEDKIVIKTDGKEYTLKLNFRTSKELESVKDGKSIPKF